MFVACLKNMVRVVTSFTGGAAKVDNDRQMTVTIDGPAGAGKSTVGKLLARQLNYHYLDTGAIYRALALRVTELGLEGAADERIGALTREVSIVFRKEDEGLRIILDGRDVSDAIRTPDIGMLASRVSAIPAVREALLIVQRNIGRHGGIVAEGRDMGTVVFPEADVKFYLDADELERSKRRYLELKAKKEDVDLLSVHEDLRKRDLQDMSRAMAPLKPAEGAVIVDSTHMDVNEVVNRMLQYIERIKRT